MKVLCIGGPKNGHYVDVSENENSFVERAALSTKDPYTYEVHRLAADGKTFAVGVTGMTPADGIKRLLECFERNANHGDE